MNIGLAVGENGTILKTINGGITWEMQSSGTSGTLNAIWFNDAENITVVGAGIHRTTNGGINWVLQPDSGDITFEDVFFIDSNIGIAVGGTHIQWPPSQFGQILRTTDSGITWAVGESGCLVLYLRAVDFADANNGIAAGNGRMLKTTNGGASWILLPLDESNGFFDIHLKDVNIGIAVGYSGMIKKTTDGGLTWAAQISGRNNTLNSISFTSPDTATVVGAAGNILKTFNGGENWIPYSTEPINGSSLCFTDANNGTIVGFSNIFRTTNGGLNWTLKKTFGSSVHLEGVSFSDTDNGTVVTYGGEIFHTSDGGISWLPQTSGTTNSLRSVSFINLNTGMIVGDNGTVLKTTNGGNTWIQLSTGTSTDLIDISVVDENNAIAVGGLDFDAAILKTTDGGLTWTLKSVPEIQLLIGVCFTDLNNATAVGHHGYILRTTNGGLSWNLQMSGTTDMLRSVSFANSNNGTAVGPNVILRTTDGGITWIKQNFKNNYCNLEDVCFIDENTWIIIGYFTVLKTTNGGGIPVELSSFTAEVSGADLKLNWMTETETNNQGFYIERRSPDEEWNTRGFVEGSGTTTEPKNYSFKEELSASGKYSYRLKQTDYDGSFEYSKVINIDIDLTPKDFVLEQNYPNPFNPNTIIKYSVPNQSSVTIKLFDALGREVRTLLNEEKPSGNHSLEFNASDLSSGIYLYQMKAGGFMQTRKMILLK